MFGRFSNFDNCRPEAAVDVMSGMAVEKFSTDERAKLGDFMLNSGQIIRIFGRKDLFYALLYSN